MAAMTLLGIVQEFCRRRGLPTPPTVTGAQDDTTLQMWGLLNEGISEISDRFEWQHLRTRYSFAHAASSGYTALDISEGGTLPDYKAMLNNTLWDTLARQPVYGPLDATSWSNLLTMQVSQAVYSYTIFGSAIRIYPVPAVLTAGQFSMEYISRYGVRDTINSVNTEFFTDDTSTCLLPANVMLADIKWRWNAAKGLAYAEDFRMCESLLTNLQGRDPAPTIQMDNYDLFDNVAAPGLLVAAGNWSV